MTSEIVHENERRCSKESASEAFKAQSSKLSTEDPIPESTGDTKALLVILVVML
jgi:hypothetical protein